MSVTRKYTAHRFVIRITAFLCLWLMAAGASAASLFWSVERDGEPAGYLLGTIHSEDARVLEYTPEFLATLETCDTFAMELVPDLVTTLKLVEYMKLPDGGDLAVLIGEQRYERVRDALAKYGVGEAQARQMQPWAAMMTLSVPPPKSGLFMDFALSLRASGSGVDVVGLETLEQQLSFLENIPLDRQLDMLDYAVAHSDEVGAIHRALVDTYLSGSLEALETMSLEQMDEMDPELGEYFMAEGIDRRNARMLKNALALLEDGRTMIAVGALHLPGENGLVQGLRAGGYSLTPLPLPFTAVDPQGAGPEPAGPGQSDSEIGPQRVAHELRQQQAEGGQRQ